MGDTAVAPKVMIPAASSSSGPIGVYGHVPRSDAVGNNKCSTEDPPAGPLIPRSGGAMSTLASRGISPTTATGMRINGAGGTAVKIQDPRIRGGSPMTGPSRDAGVIQRSPPGSMLVPGRIG